MKKLLVMLFLSMMVVGIGTAHAVITVDGMVSPSGEWDTWFIRGTDVNEGNIDDDYDIKLLLAWWDDTNVYIRSDVFGVPTLAKQDPGNDFPAFYSWTIDTTGDEVGDLRVRLELANQSGGNDRVALYRLDTNALLGYGPAVLGNIVEGSFATGLIPDELEPASDFDVSMFMRLDNAGNDPDDRLPNAGWVHTVPEPSSMLLLGVGLIGFVGRVVRKKFVA